MIGFPPKLYLILKESFDLNFYAHQYLSQACIDIMLKQNTGGVLLYNITKQAVNPGNNFGPYGIPKASTLFLMRQYTLEYGKYGIRSNGINADRIQSGLLTEELIKQRAKARNISKVKYLSNNFLSIYFTSFFYNLNNFIASIFINFNRDINTNTSTQ